MGALVRVWGRGNGVWMVTWPWRKRRPTSQDRKSSYVSLPDSNQCQPKGLVPTNLAGAVMVGFSVCCDRKWAWKTLPEDVQQPSILLGYQVMSRTN